ncbi:MAG TPA: non-heme iron oxygenase ferredoxin subunit [Acidimicrobiales bacterium]|nr:non-heme iron oxygenase ferredoxin subunit [Acidimicrobiales bacterium]
MSTERLCALDELTSGAAGRFDVGGHRLAVVRLDDDVYVIGDRCSHQNVSLYEGDVISDTRQLECWKHGSAFSLETGEPSSLPATKAVPVYDVKVIDGDVWVEIP